MGRAEVPSTLTAELLPSAGVHSDKQFWIEWRTRLSVAIFLVLLLRTTLLLRKTYPGSSRLR